MKFESVLLLLHYLCASSVDASIFSSDFPKDLMYLGGGSGF